MEKKYLVVITTYGAPAYIDLSLSFLKLFDIDAIVCDDCSNDSRLKEVCERHDVPLFSPEKHFEEYGLGDVWSTWRGMKYAVENNYTHLIKISRRWIFLKSPIESLEFLEEISDAATYTNLSYETGLGFRTECICFRMKEWSTVMDEIKEKVDKNECGCLIEGFMHHYARKIEPTSEKYRKYCRCFQFLYEYSGYAHWAWIGNAKAKTPEYILWHDSDSPLKYYEKAIEIGKTNWKLEDFEKI